MSLNNTGTMAAGPPSKPNSTQPAKGKDAHVLPQPVLLHSTPAAQAGRYLHLAGLLGLFGSQFNSLVEDPVRTLQNTLPLVAIIQVAYVSACLPVAGSQATKAVRKPRPGEKRKQEHAGPNPYVALFLSLVLTALVTPAVHLAYVLFGAPFLTHIPQTLLLSAHLSILALFPLFFAHGVDSAAWRAIGGAMAPFDETFGGCAGALLGAWLGAIPIPLDWDREWQKWPITIVCGLYAGYAGGKVLGGSVLLGKRMVSNAVKED